MTACFYCTKPRTSKLTHPSPDIDNYLKSLLDALTQVGMWEDDKQIVSVHASKEWTTLAGFIDIHVVPAT